MPTPARRVTAAHPGTLMAAVLAAFLCAAPASAQEGRPKGAEEPPAAAPADARPRGARNQLSDAEQTAAWSAQAKGVAARLGLSPEQTEALDKMYTEARTSHTAAMLKVREELMQKMQGGDAAPGGAGAAGMALMREAQQAEADKFKAAVAAALSPEQTDQVMAGLGTFNRQWDLAAHRVIGLNLEPAAQQKTMDAVEAFIAASSKARAGMGTPEYNREAAGAAVTEARTTLFETLKSTLNEQQLAAVESAIPAPRR